ncbi:MAG: protease pro-enzyme activation domain-containing protein, partial [Candidatus Limnocylindrales bacterium]
MRPRKSLPATIATSIILVTALLMSSAGIVGAASPTAVRGTKPAWATSGRLVRHVAPDEVIGFRLYLGWRDAAGAEALARAVSDPASTSYGKFLTPAQFRKRFAPTINQVGAVQNWLRNAGFKITHTPSNNHFVAAKGTARKVEAAFNTKLNIYKIKGMKLRAPSTALKMPASIAKLISGAIGIDESNLTVHSNTKVDSKAPPSAGFRNSPPLSSYWAELVSPYAYPTGFTDVGSPATAPWTVRGYTPDQIKGAYGI